MESNQKLKCMIVQKAKGYPIKEKYQNSFTQWDVIVSKRTKRSNVMTEKKIESNVKLQVMLSSLMGGYICILL